MRAAQNAHALRNALQAKPGAPVRFFIRREAAPVVTDRERQLASVYRQVERHFGRAGMFENVVETLLHDAIKMISSPGVEEAIQFVKLVRELNRRTGADFFNHRHEGRAQAELIEMRRAQVVRDRAHLFERLRDGVAELRELRPGLLVRHSQRIEQRAVFDDQQILAQAVVQFGGDAFALGLLRFDQLAREGLLRGLSPFQLRDAVFEDAKDCAAHRQRDQRQKPPRAIKRRQHRDAHTFAFRIPHAVAVGRDDCESVIARRHIRIICRAPRPRFHPILVEAFQLVFEAQVGGIDKAERRILDLEVLLSRR